MQHHTADASTVGQSFSHLILTIYDNIHPTDSQHIAVYSGHSDFAIHLERCHVAIYQYQLAAAPLLVRPHRQRMVFHSRQSLDERPHPLYRLRRLEGAAAVAHLRHQLPNLAPRFQRAVRHLVRILHRSPMDVLPHRPHISPRPENLVFPGSSGNGHTVLLLDQC